jgi:anti-anti-sigma regulatory factor
MTIERTDQRAAVESLSVHVSQELGCHIVHASGVVTATTRNALFCSCLAPGQVHVVVDMKAVSLLDREGYSAVLAARRVLEAEGGSLVLRHVASSAAGFVLSTGDPSSSV